MVQIPIPLRKDRQLQNKHLKKNVWYDYGEGKGGNVINFVCSYLKSQGENDTVIDALRWPRNMMGNDYVVPVKAESDREPKPTLAMHRLQEIKHPGLVAYLKDRGIPVGLAKLYLKEAVMINVEKGTKFHALAMRNEDDGFELKNMFFKGCFGRKSITFIRGSEPLTTEVHFFEGMEDFLSAACLQSEQKFEDDVIILHSVANVAKGLAYIKGYPLYKTVISWMDNDKAGESATAALKAFCAEANLAFRPMNELYAEYQDVNAWYQQQPKPKGG